MKFLLALALCLGLPALAAQTPEQWMAHLEDEIATFRALEAAEPGLSDLYLGCNLSINHAWGDQRFPNAYSAEFNAYTNFMDSGEGRRILTNLVSKQEVRRKTRDVVVRQTTMWPSRSAWIVRGWTRGHTRSPTVGNRHTWLRLRRSTPLEAEPRASMAHGRPTYVWPPVSVGVQRRHEPPDDRV